MKIFTQKLLQNSTGSLVRLVTSILIISLLINQNSNAQSSATGIFSDFGGFYKTSDFNQKKKNVITAFLIATLTGIYKSVNTCFTTQVLTYSRKNYKNNLIIISL